MDGTASRLLLIAVEQTNTLNAAADQWEEALCLHKFHWLLFVMSCFIEIIALVFVNALLAVGR